jgi:DNA-binding NarL/FixJ family response regulator
MTPAAHQSNEIAFFHHDPSVVAAVRDLLEGIEEFVLQGYDNALLGLSQLTGSPPAAVLAVVDLPIIDGYQLCSLMQSPDYPTLNGIPVILMGDEMPEYEEQALTCGAACYLPWPSDAQQLLEALIQVTNFGAEEEPAEAEETFDVAVELEEAPDLEAVLDEVLEPKLGGDAEEEPEPEEELAAAELEAALDPEGELAAELEVALGEEEESEPEEEPEPEPALEEETAEPTGAPASEDQPPLVVVAGGTREVEATVAAGVGGRRYEIVGVEDVEAFEAVAAGRRLGLVVVVADPPELLAGMLELLADAYPDVPVIVGNAGPQDHELTKLCRAAGAVDVVQTGTGYPDLEHACAHHLRMLRSRETEPEARDLVATSIFDVADLALLLVNGRSLTVVAANDAAGALYVMSRFDIEKGSFLDLANLEAMEGLQKGFTRALKMGSHEQDMFIPAAKAGAHLTMHRVGWGELILVIVTPWS